VALPVYNEVKLMIMLFVVFTIPAFLFRSVPFVCHHLRFNWVKRFPILSHLLLDEALPMCNKENLNLNLLYLIYSPLFLRDFNFATMFLAHFASLYFAIGEKKCVCSELNFAKLTIQSIRIFNTFTLIKNCNKSWTTSTKPICCPYSAVVFLIKSVLQ